jgi:hypothetical protein
MNDPRIEEVRYLGAVAIETTCGFPDCTERTVAASVRRESEDTPRVSWLCSEHADAMSKHTVVQKISPTCGRNVNPRCGATTTHVAVMERRDGEVGSVSVCVRHAESAPPIDE